MTEKHLHKTAFNLTVLIAGLGYLVDTFDFFLYNSMRVTSLTELGLSGDALTKAGITILNCQIFGALIGSFFWGILGDKIGRKKALLGSIFVYSFGMVVNGFVQDAVSYEIVRLIIGFGVAGEVGLGATLVAENVSSSKRTYALMYFTVMGVLGVVIAGMGLEFVSWRTCCFAGGVFGLLLLTLRSALFESKLFVETTQSSSRRGSLRDLFGKLENLKKYLACFPILAANFFVTGILLTLALEVARSSGAQGVVKANIALALYFFVAAFGDAFGAWLSERLRSRRAVAGLFVCANATLAFTLIWSSGLTVQQFYVVCAAFGLGNLWAISGTIVTEQFPTTLRATASTSSFNVSRSIVILMNFALLNLKPQFGMIPSLSIIGAVIFGLGLFAIWRLPETYGRSLEL
jgi:MFS family permease